MPPPYRSGPSIDYSWIRAATCAWLPYDLAAIVAAYALPHYIPFEFAERLADVLLEFDYYLGWNVGIRAFPCPLPSEILYIAARNGRPPMCRVRHRMLLLFGLFETIMVLGRANIYVERPTGQVLT